MEGLVSLNTWFKSELTTGVSPFKMRTFLESFKTLVQVVGVDQSTTKDAIPRSSLGFKRNRDRSKICAEQYLITARTSRV